jgi:hypothetical protein
MGKLVLEVGESFARPEIDVVERDRAHADAYLARSRFGELDRGALEDFGAARSAHHHRFGLHAAEPRPDRHSLMQGGVRRLARLLGEEPVIT